MKFFPLMLSTLIALAGAQAETPDFNKAPYPTIGSIERVDPGLDDLIDPEAKIEILAKGFVWSEGPVWVKDGGYVIFSDIPPNNIWKWQEGKGLSLYLHPSGYTNPKKRGGEIGSNGLTIDSKGRLVLCQHGDRRIARMKGSTSRPKPEYETLAGKWDGKRFNSPNDLVYHANGDLYFTDPPYGLEKNVRDPAKEIDFQGVYRLTKDGKVTLLTKEMTRPNGIALSPDAKTLYVANSDGGKNAIWKSFPIKEDGTLGPGKIFIDANAYRKPGRKGGQDGMKVDAKGNIFATGPGGVLVFTDQGKHLGTILTTERTANCAFGDDGKTLYMTADMYLLRVRLKTKGLGF